MYGSQSDSGNWDHMLDGTMDSIMQMQEPGELEKLDNLQLRTSSTLADDQLGSEKQQLKELVTSMMTILDEMECERRKYQATLGQCIHQFEKLKSGSILCMSRLDMLHQTITCDPDMVKMGRSNHEGDQHMTNKSQCKNAVSPSKRGDVDRDGGSPLLLASFQDPDDCEILSRIDLLKKNAAVSSGNQEAHCWRMASPPSLGATVAAREGGGVAAAGVKEADENRAKLVPLSRQVKLPETLEATSPLETNEQG